VGWAGVYVALVSPRQYVYALDANGGSRRYYCMSSRVAGVHDAPTPPPPRPAPEAPPPQAPPAAPDMVAHRAAVSSLIFYMFKLKALPWKLPRMHAAGGAAPHTRAPVEKER